MKNLVMLMVLVVLMAGFANAAVLYNIDSFNNTGVIASDMNWHAGITTITVMPGLTGTDDAQLKTLAAASGLQPDIWGGQRFRNVESHNAAKETVTLDPAGGAGYMQFGIAGTNIALTELSFLSRAATGNDNVGRGYSVTVSIDGGAYAALASGLVISGRTNGNMDTISIDLTGAQYQGISSVDFRVSAVTGGVEFTDILVSGTADSPLANNPDPFNGETLVEANLADRIITGELSWDPPVYFLNAALIVS